MSTHEGVSCDACGKSNFRSKRFKCLICYDYDLCSTCHEQGETSSHHTIEHPMQCILTQQDFDLYYHREKYIPDHPQSLTCPFCGEMGFALPFLNESSSSSNNNSQNVDLFQHLQTKHSSDSQSREVICPICAGMVSGEPHLVTGDLIAHISNDHQPSQVNTPSISGETNAYSRQSIFARDYDFGGTSGGRGSSTFRRGSSRIASRRNGSGRGGALGSRHLVPDNSSGLSAIGSGNYPIADILTQLSTVRRLAAANNSGTNNNSWSTTSPNTINLQTLTRQQYERERLRAAVRSHQQSNSAQQSSASTSTSNVASSVENDLFESLFSSALFIDPLCSSTNSQQGWLHMVTKQSQAASEQSPQVTSTAKNSTTTNAESDPSLLRRMCDESFSIRQDTAASQSSKQRNDFVQSLLFSSFADLISDK